MAEKRNFRLVIEYDGTGYHGWQRQKTEPSIQEKIEEAIFTMVRQPVKLKASGRTDAGVHALGQVANFACKTSLSTEVFLRGLNSILPDDIVIRSCDAVDPRFHARYNAVSKTYRYNIWNSPLPPAIGRQYVWFVRSKLYIDAMQAAAGFLVGEHDFKGFEGTGSPRSHTVRTVMRAVVQELENGRIAFEIQANGFLRYMVRNIVGTLVEVGMQKRRPEEMQEILQSRDRSRAGATAPAQGLFLLKVDY